MAEVNETVRMHVAWNEIQPGDSIIACNDVLWSTKHVVISTKPPKDVGDEFFITYQAEGEPAVSTSYFTSFKWLVERVIPRCELRYGSALPVSATTPA